MKLWKVVKDNDLNTLKVGDTVKVGDIETQITELQKGIETGKVIGFFTKDKINNHHFWGCNTSGEEVSLLLNTSKEGGTEKGFTKSDLKTGMIIEQRNGDKAMVLLGTVNGDIVSGQTWYPLTSLKEDLTNQYSRGCYDIVKVYQPRSNRDYLGLDSIWDQYNVIWEREVPKSKEQIAYEEALEAAQAAKEAYELSQKKLEALNPNK